jgi:hypothetical protein
MTTPIVDLRSHPSPNDITEMPRTLKACIGCASAAFLPSGVTEPSVPALVPSALGWSRI